MKIYIHPGGEAVLLEVCGEKLSINYIDEGDKSSPALIFLHGWGAYAEAYRVIINMLSPNFRVLAPDMPGHGKSDEPSFPYKAQDYAEFVSCFAEQLGVKKAVLIGHSHGGRTAIKLLTGKRIPFEVEKAVLIDSAGLIRKKSLSQKYKIAKFKLLKKLYSLSPVKKLAPDAIEKLRKKNGSADYAAASPIMRKSMVSVINEDLSESLSEIKVPTLLIWGDKDTDTPMYMAHEMEKKIPDSGLVVIPGGGHFSFLADLQLTKRVLDSFLLS